MNKHLQLPVDIELVHHSGQTVLRLRFHREALRDWCLGLTLLSDALIENLSVTGEHGRKGVQVQLGAKPDGVGPVRVSLKPDPMRVEITCNNMDYLQHFFLKYYRDGVAEVDHIDLQAIDMDSGEEGIYVTFQVPDARPSVSAGEAERRLRN